MDTRIVLAMLISTILGATIGFGASYVMFSSPIQSLRDDLSKAMDDISGMDSELNGAKDDIAGLESGLASAESSVISLESGLSTAQSDLGSLTSTVSDMDAREWHEVRSVIGVSDLVTTTFQLKGKMLQISWLFNGLSTDAWVWIGLCFSNGTIYWLNGSSGVFGAFDAEGAILEPGLYYLDIRSYNASSWAVSIYDYY